jgi:hypothetical protein
MEENMNVDDNAIYGFPIHATEPLADARAARFVVTDAPAIAADERVVLGDLSNSIREVNNRIFLKAQPPELVTVTSDEVSSSVMRQFVVTSKLAAVHHGEIAGAPIWAQLLVDQGRDTAAQVAALTIQGRDTAAEVAALTIQVRDTAAQVAALTIQGRDNAAQATAQIATINNRLANIDARHRNAQANVAQDLVIPLVAADGAIPDGFPPSLSDFHDLSNAEVMNLLQFYDIRFRPRDSQNSRRRRLHQFLGIPSSINKY